MPGFLVFRLVTQNLAKYLFNPMQYILDIEQNICYTAGMNKTKAELRVRNRVKLARVERGYTQQELANLIGVTRQTIGLIEAERYNPTISLCLRLAQALHKSLTDLFWAEELT